MTKPVFRLLLMGSVLWSGLATGQSQPVTCSGTDWGKWHNCIGSLNFSMGESYYGQFNNGRFHGRGRFTFVNTYSGEWFRGERIGTGVEYDRRGQIKSGLWNRTYLGPARNDFDIKQYPFRGEFAFQGSTSSANIKMRSASARSTKDSEYLAAPQNQQSQPSSGQATRNGSAKGVVVSGSGLSKEEAKKDAFRRAIEQTLGALVISERRLTNSDLFEEDITFANGVISSYSVVSEKFDLETGVFSIKLDVVVSKSTIEKRIFASQGASAIDGGLISQAIESSRAAADSEMERFNGARSVLLYLSKNLAASIFDVKVGEVSVEKAGDTTELVLSMDMSVNKNAFDSLCNATKDYIKAAAPLQSFPYPSHKNFEIRDDSPSFFHRGGCKGSTDPRTGWPQGYIVGLEWDLVNTMIAAVTPLGACVSFENETGAKVLRDVFYKIDLCQKQQTWPPEKFYYGNGFCAGGIPNLNFGKNNLTYVSVVLDRPTKHRLLLPEAGLESLRRVKTIKAQMTSEVACGKAL